MIARTLSVLVLCFACDVAVGDEKAVASAKGVVFNLSDGTRDGVETDDRNRLRLKKVGDDYAKTGGVVSAPVDLGEPGTARVNWIEQWTAPQRWIKHAGNPIYGPKQSGKWDGWTNGVSIVRNPDGKSYKMFYSGRKGSGIGFAEASIADPLAWKENPASPVLKPRTDNWEGNLINQPRVVKVTDDHWRMYYTGWGHNVKYGTTWAFGMAESFDGGVSWERRNETPMLERGDKGTYDDGGVFVPEVRRVGDGWMMWYTGLKVIPGRQAIHLCAATSDDGITWKKYAENPVITDDFEKGPSRNVISRCHVRIDDGVFRIWYSHAKPQYRIRYAESLDGLHWELSPIVPVLDASSARPDGTAGKAWDSDMVEYPELDIVDGKWRLWFCGNGFGSVGFAEGIVETGVKLWLRSGAVAEPDKSWSDWKTIARDQPFSGDRFVQLKAELWSDNPQLSPALNKVEILR